MTETIDRIVIVGGGHAGGVAAIVLRQKGFEGEIIILGDEGVVPYQRPPLSKAFLKSDLDISKVQLRSSDDYEKNHVTTRLNVRVTAVNPANKSVEIECKETLSYDRLILATGSKNRRFLGKGGDLEGVHYLRTLAEAEKVKADMQSAKRLVVIGGGYIGLEVAATARLQGLSVAVVEREERLLKRVASPFLSQFFEDYHRNRGVEIINKTSVAEIIGRDNGRVGAVRLSNGRQLDCNMVLVGIGATARDDLARAAGLECNNGVVVDELAKTSDPNIYAIGDVSNRPLHHYEGKRIRLESVPNAIEQAKVVAADVTGAEKPVPELPWFWSDQFDLKLQIAGLLFDVDQTLLKGSPEDGAFVLYHLSNGKPVAVEAVNSLRDFMAAKKMVVAKELDPKILREAREL